MGDAKLVEEIIIKKMTERAVAHVVEKPRDAHVLFNEWSRGALVAENFAQRRIEVFGKFPGEVHGAQGMLKAAVLRGWIHPASALQLVDIAQPLHPSRVDQLFLGHLPLFFWNGELNITVNRIRNQSSSLVFVIGHISHRCSTRPQR